MADNERFLAIFASGSGSTGAVLFDMAQVVVTDNPEAGIIQRVKDYNLDHPGDHIGMEIVPRPTVRVEGETWGGNILSKLEKYDPRFVSLNGFDRMLPSKVVKEFAGRVANVHPAPLDPEHRLLLPDYLREIDQANPFGRQPLDFGGKGMHGLVPHEAVLTFARWCGRVHEPFRSEVCIHRVESGIYDNGAVLARASVGVDLKSDTAQSLQDRAKGIEKNQNFTFWTAVKKTGEFPAELSLKEPLIKESEIGILWQARALALAVHSH